MSMSVLKKKTVRWMPVVSCMFTLSQGEELYGIVLCIRVSNLTAAQGFKNTRGCYIIANLFGYIRLLFNDHHHHQGTTDYRCLAGP